MRIAAPTPKEATVARFYTQKHAVGRSPSPGQPGDPGPGGPNRSLHTVSSEVFRSLSDFKFATFHFGEKTCEIAMRTYLRFLL